jgi:membrane-bound serine protease (ClpP class)
MWHALKRVASSSAPRRTLPCLPRGIALWLFLICCSSVLSLPHSAAAQTQINVNTIYVLTFSGPVTPVLESYLNQAIREAEAEGASAIILQLDTPGGSVDVTQSIIQNMLASPVPLVVYVAPAGARAGSAGTFITLAAHIAAMAPSTSIGAASPVELGGGDVDSTLADKITNILSADIENLATRRGEAATEWAIAAVQEAAAATAQQALDLGVIDVIANDIDHLIELLEGRTIELPSGPTVLHVTNAVVVAQEMTPIQRALNILVDPAWQRSCSAWVSWG